MHLVAQITPFTCVLACLESYLYDQGIFISQCEMIALHPDICIDVGKPDQAGALTDEKLIQLCGRLLLAAELFRDHRPEVVFKALDTLTPEQTIFFLANWHNSGNHCVRFVERSSNQSLRVMNPAYLRQRFDEVTFGDLVSWNFSFVRIHRAIKR